MHHRRGDDGDPAKDGSADSSKPKHNGYGRNGAADYTGAIKVPVPHETLKTGDPCPECPRGKVYPMKQPAVLVRITGMAPLTASVYERERLRCNLCGEICTAQSPTGVGKEKYDAEAASMIALLKYGTGVPFNRLEQLQGSRWRRSTKSLFAKQPKGTCSITMT